MRSSHSKAAHALAWAALFLVLSAAAAIGLRLKPWQNSDPDYYYHVALSRQSEVLSAPKTLPQVPGIGWDQQFVDKEYLYHRLTTLADRVGGESAVSYLPLLLWCLTLALLWAALAPARIGTSRALIAIAPPLLCFHFAMREQLLRPHNLAIPLVMLLFIAMRARKPLATALVAALFALSYHALQVPLILLAAYLAAIWSARQSADPADPNALRENRRELRVALALVIGLAAGLLANPYYPEVLFVTIQVIWLAFDLVGQGSLPYGAELYPWTTSQFLSTNPLPLVALILAAIAGEYASFAALATAGFTALGLLSPRALEYAIPFSALLLGHLFLTKKIRSKLAYAAIAVAALVEGANMVKLLRAPPFQWERASDTIAAAKAIPKEGAGKLVLNCSWDISPYIFYARPDVKFVDLLDPSFLYTASPKAHEARTQLDAAIVADPYGMLKEAFGASYVICDHPPLVAQLDRDPRFRRLHPPQARPGTSLFELRTDPENFRFATAFELARAPDGVPGDLAGLRPDAKIGWTPSPTNANQLPYVDLIKWLPPPQASAAKTTPRPCYWVRPAAGSLDRFAGSGFVGVGGGTEIRLWLNGKEHYQSVQATSVQRVLDLLVPIPAKLKTSDQLVALVCAKTAGDFVGLALSFWTDAQIDSYCETHGNPYKIALAERKRWQYFGMRRPSCLAPIAASP